MSHARNHIRVKPMLKVEDHRLEDYDRIAVTRAMADSRVFGPYDGAYTLCLHSAFCQHDFLNQALKRTIVPDNRVPPSEFPVSYARSIKLVCNALTYYLRHNMAGEGATHNPQWLSTFYGDDVVGLNGQTALNECQALYKLGHLLYLNECMFFRPIVTRATPHSKAKGAHHSAPKAMSVTNRIRSCVKDLTRHGKRFQFRMHVGMFVLGQTAGVQEITSIESLIHALFPHAQ
ncbi:hypothetical protein KIPB_005099 [Kipferlia bialata]|uniref:Uncharacterized protein n=1 Tax=Kipferlia bialata TaxID=797122 RepID=A0A9K3CWI9_9EUKA|nr:hypothetical protein KIPB_005099 [Kipferlia bialata]|eukprot:g5099.t1